MTPPTQPRHFLAYVQTSAATTTERGPWWPAPPTGLGCQCGILITGADCLTEMAAHVAAEPAT